MVTTKKLKPACPTKKFDKITPLVPSIVGMCCIDEKFPKATSDQRDWFMALTDWWVRFHYANNARWRAEIDGEDERDFVYTFVMHWAEGFALNPVQYIERHREANINSTDPEWKAGGILAG